VVHAGLLQAPDAHLTPAGNGHVLDEGFFEGGLGLEFLEQGSDERKKAIRGLAFENYRAGEMPCFMALREEASFPVEVTGPRDLDPFARDACC
jgi:hypothetical protein